MDTNANLPTLHFNACLRADSAVDAQNRPKDLSFTMDVADVLGTGGCSIVYRLSCPDFDAEKKSLAAKFLVIRNGRQQDDELPKEAGMLKEISHSPYIMKYHGLFEVDLDAQPKMRGFFTKSSARNPPKTGSVSPVVPPSTGRFLLEELCCCTLHNLVDNFSFKESEAAFTLNSALRGLQHLHDLGIVHGDIKTANIMVADGGLRVLLGDFDLASHLPDGPETAEITWTGGTLGYLAPEVYANRKGGKATDLFALGAVLYILLTKSQPFLHDTPLLTQLATQDGRLPIEPEMLQMFRSDAACDLLFWLLEPRPEDRPSAAAALESEWFCIKEFESDGLRALVQRWKSADIQDQTDVPGTKTSDSATKPVASYSVVHSSLRELRRNFVATSPFVMLAPKKQAAAADESGPSSFVRKARTFASSARSVWSTATAAVSWKKSTKVKPVNEADEFDNVFIP